MKQLFGCLLAAAAIIVLPTVGRADTIDDPLHGITCAGPGGTNCVNTDNNNFAPLTGSSWGFSISPGNNATGNLTIVFGVPTDEINTGTFLLPSILDNGSINVTTTVFSRTSFYNTGSPVLSSFLGISGTFTPTDNFSNLSVGTSAQDPGFGGNYLVFTATLNGITLDGSGAPTTLLNDFTFGSNAPAGSFITGLFTEPNGNLVGTAASGHLVVQPFAAVPGPTVGAGLNGLLAVAIGALIWFARRRRSYHAFAM